MSGVGSTRPWKGPSDRSTWRERATLRRASRADLAGPLGMESGMGLETAQRTGNQSFLDSFGFARPKVLVIGCGGAGGNSVHRLHRMGIHGARTVVVNTDAVHLDSIQADRKLLIGRGVTHGMGAGGRPEIGERCAEISEQELRNQIGDADLTFITVGLGGGTGTGVAPHVAELAQAAGSVVISLATTPFRAERGRMIHVSAGPGLPLRTAHEVVEGLTAAMRPDANVIFGVRVDRKYSGILRVLVIMTGVRSPLVEAVRESVSVADVVSDGSSRRTVETEFHRAKPRR